MNRGGLGLAYVVKSTAIPGGGFRPAAHVACGVAGCAVVETLSMVNRTNNPEWVAERMRFKGWECDGFHAGRNRCPTCIAAARARRHGESPGNKPDPSKGDTVMVQSSKVTDLSVVPPGARPPAPTPEQKKAIRDALDGCYDERLGLYLDGQSDQLIAARLKLPMIMVRTLREAAYGPLKPSPDLEELRVQVRGFNERAETLKREASALDDLARDLGARIVALGRQYGIDAAALVAPSSLPRS